MKKIFLLIFCIVSLLSIFAQTPPAWYDWVSRNELYPEKSYFTGFAEGIPSANESIEITIQRLKDAARVEALSKIRIHVKSQTESSLHAESFESLDDWDETIKETLESNTTTKVDLEVNGLQIEVWHNSLTNTISAFAYINKSSLIRQLEKQIIVALTKVEISLDQVNKLIANGQKIHARGEAEKILPLFAEIHETQKLLISIDTNATDESLMLTESRNLQQQLITLVIQLKNSLTLCINSRAMIFDAIYSDFQSLLQGQLSDLGCNFVTTPTQADWVIDIQAQAREYNTIKLGGTSTYFVYVDATLTIIKTTTGQCVYKNVFSEKGAHTRNIELAAQDAYMILFPKISGILKEEIKNN